MVRGLAGEEGRASPVNRTTGQGEDCPRIPSTTEGLVPVTLPLGAPCCHRVHSGVRASTASHKFWLKVRTGERPSTPVKHGSSFFNPDTSDEVCFV